VVATYVVEFVGFERCIEGSDAVWSYWKARQAEGEEVPPCSV
jgi:hypothetical protein